MTIPVVVIDYTLRSTLWGIRIIGRVNIHSTDGALELLGDQELFNPLRSKLVPSLVTALLPSDGEVDVILLPRLPRSLISKRILPPPNPRVLLHAFFARVPLPRVESLRRLIIPTLSALLSFQALFP